MLNLSGDISATAILWASGMYVEGNAEIAATADFISRHLLILGVDSNHDIYVFAGALGLGAPAHLAVDESLIIMVHFNS